MEVVSQRGEASRPDTDFQADCAQMKRVMTYLGVVK
jgi:hypothetical protein